MASLKNPPGHVRPYACATSLAWYKVWLAALLVVAVAMCAVFDRVALDPTLLSEPHLFGDTRDNWFGVGMLLALVFVAMLPISLDRESGPFVFVHWNVLRLARTPVGWALLREGANLAKDRRALELIAAYPGAVSSAERPEADTIRLAQMHGNQIDLEANLVRRQQRHLAGKRVKFIRELACAP